MKQLRRRLKRLPQEVLKKLHFIVKTKFGHLAKWISFRIKLRIAFKD
ncbi:hypothetical protein B4U80_03290 [Leptotrombidium deliense]|uniref:Uncharacterized protein n=1 Tax=Leptotrombidium deliense TaxID=299467 RepID=A0A443RVX3_9ACAR|nr:hypothetical protein B4U80_03290 [Leptotrombidium deliense]